MNQEPHRILIFYAHIQSYVWAQFRALAQHYPVELRVVHWPTKSDSPYVVDDVEEVALYSKKHWKTSPELLDWAKEFNPHLVVAVGRMDSDYLQVMRYFRKQGVPTVSGMDNQWKGSFRQRINVLIRNWTYKRYYSHIMVPGPYQWEYARRLGYARSSILRHYYTADLDQFNSIYEGKANHRNGKDSKKRLLFVGRLVEEKGIDLLCQAFIDAYELGHSDWELLVVGMGELRESLPDHSAIVYKGFLQPLELAEEALHAHAFCLPSRFEPWGVVVQEMAAAGLPLLCSRACGAAASFVYHGYNGYLFTAHDRQACRSVLLRLMSQSREELQLMGRRSHQLAQKAPPGLWAAELFSLLT